MNKYYVYTHSYNDVVFYVGKGSGKRYKSTKNRSAAWLDFVSSLPEKYSAQIVVPGLTENEALEIETRLIGQLNGLLNVSTTNKRLDYSDIKWGDLFYYDETSPSSLRYNSDTNAINPINKRFKGDPAGYQKFYKNGKAQEWTLRVRDKAFRAHLVVCILNGVEIPSGMVVNHIDNNPHNNLISNLEVCSHSQNMQRTARHTEPERDFLLREHKRNSVHSGISYVHYSVRCRYTLNGKRLSKDFSYLKFGKDQAWEAARAFRDSVLLEIYNVQTKAVV